MVRASAVFFVFPIFLAGCEIIGGAPFTSLGALIDPEAGVALDGADTPDGAGAGDPDAADAKEAEEPQPHDSGVVEADAAEPRDAGAEAEAPDACTHFVFGAFLCESPGDPAAGCPYGSECVYAPDYDAGGGAVVGQWFSCPNLPAECDCQERATCACIEAHMGSVCPPGTSPTSCRLGDTAGPTVTCQ